MNCSDVRKFLFVYLDGEFEPADQREFEAHVSTCESCRDALKSEGDFQRDLKNKLPPLTAPDYLRERVVASLAEETGEPGSEAAPFLIPWAFRLAPLALAAAVLVVVAWPNPEAVAPAASESEAVARAANPVGSASSIPVSFANGGGAAKATLASYQTLPADIRGGAPDIKRYMQSRVSFAVEAPVSEEKELKLEGARQVRYQGRPAVLFIYRYGGERISILQYRGVGNAIGPSLQLERRGTVTAGQFRRGNNHYLVVTALEPEVLSRVLSRINR